MKPSSLSGCQGDEGEEDEDLSDMDDDALLSELQQIAGEGEG